MTNSIKLDYLQPPITEAVIEAKISHEMTIKDIDKVVKEFQKTYPKKDPINDYGISLNMESKIPEVAISSNKTRYLLSSDDRVDIAMISRISLAVACLAPYKGWDDLNQKFLSAWKSWMKIAKLKPIERIGVRYINRIDIPLGNENKINLEDYLTIYPKVPELSDSPMDEYLIQVTQPIDKLWSATITSVALSSSPLVKHLSLLLNIDTFRTQGIPLKDKDLFEMIDTVREIKNRVFESCITQKTRDLFNAS